MRSVRSAHGFSESLCCRPDNVWGGSLPTFQGYCAKASRSRVQVNSDTNAHTKTKEMTRLRLQVLCVGQCLGMYACDWSWVEFLLLVFQTGDTSTRRKSRDKWKKRRKKCEAERTDAPRQRYEEKGWKYLFNSEQSRLLRLLRWNRSRRPAGREEEGSERRRH